VRFAVLVQPTAEEEIDAAFVYMASEASLEVAARWYNRLEEVDSHVGELATPLSGRI
jgi:plasmid stabilization system protein ParE